LYQPFSFNEQYLVSTDSPLKQLLEPVSSRGNIERVTSRGTMQVNEDVASSNLELDLKRALDLSNQIMGLMGSKDALETYR